MVGPHLGEDYGGILHRDEEEEEAPWQVHVQDLSVWQEDSSVQMRNTYRSNIFGEKVILFWKLTILPDGFTPFPVNHNIYQSGICIISVILYLRYRLFNLYNLNNFN